MRGPHEAGEAAWLKWKNEQSAFALWASARQPSLASLPEGGRWLAEPKLAKAGGARRDRTADLLHAMQALSQLSYGPIQRPGGLGDAPGSTVNHSSRIISSVFY